MKTATVLKTRTRKYCELYERGLITATEFHMSLVELMIDAKDDTVCTELCTELPEPLRQELLQWLNELDEMDYYFRSFFIGDARTTEQRKSDDVERQVLLRRLAPRLRAALQT